MYPYIKKEKGQEPLRHTPTPMFLRLHLCPSLKLSTIVITTWQYEWECISLCWHLFSRSLKSPLVSMLYCFFSGPPTECFMFHSRAAVAKLHSANEVRADYFVSNCSMVCIYQLKSYVAFACCELLYKCVAA